MIDQSGNTSQPDHEPPSVELHQGRHTSHAHERIREGVTMALYIGLSLLAVLMAQETSLDPAAFESPALDIVLTSAGLILAHMLAFQLSTRLVHRGEMSPAHADLLWTQFLGGLAVTLVAVTPVLLIGGPGGVLTSKLLLIGLIAGVGYAAARSVPLSRPRALVYVGIVVVLALVVLWVKGLVHH